MTDDGHRVVASMFLARFAHPAIARCVTCPSTLWWSDRRPTAKGQTTTRLTRDSRASIYRVSSSLDLSPRISSRRCPRCPRPRCYLAVLSQNENAFDNFARYSLGFLHCRHPLNLLRTSSTTLKRKRDNSIRLVNTEGV
jgi:hypothetical protein